MKTAIWLTLILLGAARTAAAQTSIENRHLRVVFDPASSTFTVRHRPAEITFIKSGRLHEANGKAKVADVEHPAWGSGQQVIVTWPSRSVTRLTLYENLPFVAVQTDLHNKGARPQTHNRINLAQLDVAGPKPADQLKAFGTFGLVDIAQKKNPGSYAQLSIVDPQSRSGVVTGWLTHDRASGVMFYERQEKHTHVTARLDHGRLLLKPGQTTPLETLLIGYFADARLGLEAYADAMAVHHQVVLPEQPTVYCTWYHGRASNAGKLKAQADFAAKNLKPFGFSVLQIDDGWQDGVSKNGPRKVFIRHKPDGPYRAGMKPVADWHRI